MKPKISENLVAKLEKLTKYSPDLDPRYSYCRIGGECNSSGPRSFSLSLKLDKQPAAIQRKAAWRDLSQRSERNQFIGKAVNGPTESWQRDSWS